jgi:hypothetical protein
MSRIEGRVRSPAAGAHPCSPVVHSGRKGIETAGTRHLRRCDSTKERYGQPGRPVKPESAAGVPLDLGLHPVHLRRTPRLHRGPYTSAAHARSRLPQGIRRAFCGLEPGECGDEHVRRMTCVTRVARARRRALLSSGRADRRLQRPRRPHILLKSRHEPLRFGGGHSPPERHPEPVPYHPRPHPTDFSTQAPVVIHSVWTTLWTTRERVSLPRRR